jgi:hypothetical protein
LGRHAFTADEAGAADGRRDRAVHHPRPVEPPQRRAKENHRRRGEPAQPSRPPPRRPGLVALGDPAEHGGLEARREPPGLGAGDGSRHQGVVALRVAEKLAARLAVGEVPLGAVAIGGLGLVVDERREHGLDVSAVEFRVVLFGHVGYPPGI